MGLSASQARLLSITQRLSDNELHSEIIANSKIRLADEGVVAKNEYLKSLEATKLQYTGFDGYGQANAVDLNFNSLMNYSELKNQNVLKNANGQVLISETDAYNFYTSHTMYDFLAKYGLFDPHEYAIDVSAFEAWQEAYDIFIQNHQAWQTLHDEYLVEHDYWQNVLMPEYEEYMNTPDAHELFVGIVGSTTDPVNPPTSCYNNALNDPSTGCYKHVLMYLLYPIDDGVPDVGGVNGGVLSPTQPETLVTSFMSGGVHATVTPTMDDWTGSKLHMNTFATTGNLLYPVYQKLLELKPDGTPRYYCDGDDSNAFATTGVSAGYNMIQNAIEVEGRAPTAAEILMSDYVYNYPDAEHPNGSVGGLKSLRQKAIDMLALIKSPQTYFGYTGVMPQNIKNILHDLLINFTDGDMSRLAIEQPEEPQFMVPEPLFTLERPAYPLAKFYDKAKTQWYINLWHAIDGQFDPSELRIIYDEDGAFDYYTVENKDRQTTYDRNGKVLNPAYEIIREELRGDSAWLNNALTNGILTLDRMILDSNENNLVWSGVEYTSTSTFVEVADEKKIAEAEVKYESEMKRIEMEDNKFDIKMKKLDTEHTALKTEYDSVAQLIGKNVERSYNTFNA